VTDAGLVLDRLDAARAAARRAATSCWPSVTGRLGLAGWSPASRWRISAMSNPAFCGASKTFVFWL
jgi:hypothetical protein